MRALLMHNPTAGEGTVDRESLCEALQSSGYSAAYHSTKGKEYEQVLQEPEAELIVIVGGDGTVGKVLRRIGDRSIPVAILPGGTANNIAASLGLSAKPLEIARNLKDAPTVPLDVGQAAGPWGNQLFLEGIGFHAFAESMSEPVPGETREARIKAGRRVLRQCIAEATPEHFKIEIDGKTVEGEFVFVEVMNIGCTGPGIVLSPQAKSGDRLLDVVSLTADRRDDMVAWLDTERWEEDIPLEVISGREVNVTTKGGTLRRDDKVLLEHDKASIIRISLEDEPFQVLVPKLG